eukprot:gene8000-23389_t
MQNKICAPEKGKNASTGAPTETSHCTTTDIQLDNDDLQSPLPLNDLAELQATVDAEVTAAIRRLGESYTSRNASLKRTRTFAVDDLVYLHRVCSLIRLTKPVLMSPSTCRSTTTSTKSSRFQALKSA